MLDTEGMLDLWIRQGKTQHNDAVDAIMSAKTPAPAQVEGDPVQAWAETHCKSNTTTDAIEVPLTLNNMHPTRKTVHTHIYLYIVN